MKMVLSVWFVGFCLCIKFINRYSKYLFLVLDIFSIRYGMLYVIWIKEWFFG